MREPGADGLDGAGILGARLFYIVQYWDQYVQFTPARAIDIPATIQAMFNVTKGGLVVYGSLLAVIPAAALSDWNREPKF